MCLCMKRETLFPEAPAPSLEGTLRAIKGNVTLGNLTSPHLTSPHLTSPHLTSPHFTSPHLT